MLVATVETAAAAAAAAAALAANMTYVVSMGTATRGAAQGKSHALLLRCLCNCRR
jgi:hypothetical protein